MDNLDRPISNKKTIVIIGGLFLVLLVLILVYFLTSRSGPKEIDVVQTPTPLARLPTGSFLSSTPQITDVTQTSPTVSISPDEQNEWPFPDISVTGTPQEYLDAQARADEEWAIAQLEVYEPHPWLGVFPLQTEDYFVVFHPKQKEFVVTLYNKNTEQQSKLEIQEIIKSMGIDITQFSFVYEAAE